MTPSTAPLIPFPSSAWIAQTRNGPALALPLDRMPDTLLPRRRSWESLFAGYSGFSTLQPVLVPTVSGCPAGLPDVGQEGWSVADTSPVILFDSASQRRVPWFGRSGEEPRYCRIHPVDAFTQDSDIHVVVTEDFAAELSPTVDPVATPYADLPASLRLLAVRSAWWFPVGGDEERLSAMYGIASAAMKATPRPTHAVVELNPNPAVWSLANPADTALVWQGMYRVPNWLSTGNRIEWGEDGKPVSQGTTEEIFYLIVPRSALSSAQLPVVQYGHGLFGDPTEVLGDALEPIRRETAGIYAAVPWGMARRHIAALVAGIKDPSELPLLRDRVYQGMSNQLVFSRVLLDELAPAVGQQFGLPVSDTVDFVGISQGSILGAVLTAISPDIRRSALHVGGGGWATMMMESTAWGGADSVGFSDAFAATMDGPQERTLFYALWQSIWDQWDAVKFAPYWFDAPSFAGLPAPRGRQVFYSYSIGDPVVPNLASETVLRAAAIPLLSPGIAAVYGIDSVSFPSRLRSVAAQWDIGGGEDAHNHTRMVPEFAAQVGTFLRNGTVIDTCGGKACRFPNP